MTSWTRGRNFPENKAPAGNVPTTLAFGGKIWFKYDVIATWRKRNWNSAQCTGGTPMMRGTSRKEEYFLRAVLKNVAQGFSFIVFSLQDTHPFENQSV